MEPGQKRDEFSQIIGSYMKMAFKNWNKEHYVSDELIKNDLLQMSKGQLAIDENVQFNNLVTSAPKSQRRVYKGMNKQNYRHKKITTIIVIIITGIEIIITNVGQSKSYICKNPA